MRWIANRKTCPSTASCLCPAALTGPPRQSSLRMAPLLLFSTAAPSAAVHRPASAFYRVAGIIIQSGAPVPPGAPTNVTATVPVPGGVTDAIENGNLLYLAGQQLQPDGYFAGYLSILDTGAKKVTGAYSIS